MIAPYSPLGAAGASWGTKGVMESEVLKGIAKSEGKSVAQIALRWVYEQGVVIVAKSFNKERLLQNLEIFDWEPSNEELRKIADIRSAGQALERCLSLKLVLSSQLRSYGMENLERIYCKSTSTSIFLDWLFPEHVTF